MNTCLNIVLISTFIFLNSATDSPIIGILSQERFLVEKYVDEKFDSFIVASYVKFLEGAGARVMPVW